MKIERKKYAVIVAGGKGSRMGNALPKQFLTLNGRPMLYYSIKAFRDAFDDIEIVLVLPKDGISYGQMVLKAFDERIDVTIVAGGETRFHSVQNGLHCVRGEAVVFVHDGARPLVSADMIRRCYKVTLQKGSAIPVVAVSDSMRIEDESGNRPVDRSKLRKVQTPQSFLSELLLPAMQQNFTDAFTDEATVVEAFGKQVYLTSGANDNIKVTTVEDMFVAEALLKHRAHLES